jgi:tetratricopeptide (TPR) repeat protein
VRGSLASANSSASDTTERATLIHRETLQLTLLVAIAIAAFFLTRAVAVSNHEMSFRDAGEWYQRGQRQLAAGDVDGAIDSFRRATVKNRNERGSVLALASALARKGLDGEARGALLALREAAPDDAEINVQLARLSAERQDVDEALRYYHNALYSPWSSEHTDARRHLRLELARFLLAHNQNSRALSELLVSTTDLEDTPADHVELARLFAQVGDTRHALDQFEAALRLDKANGDALAGAGGAAFGLGDYAMAIRYLRAAPPQADHVSETLEVVELVLSSDPLASRLVTAERRRRLLADVEYVEERLSACAGQPGSGEPTTDQADLLREAESLEQELQPHAVEASDMIETGVDLIYRIARTIAQRCPPPSPLNQALILIGQRHGADQR